MATTAGVGSAAWIAAEKENVQQLLQQERDEVVFPAQHEMEWLNEHMADIFSKGHVDVANVFKTPGKLKGKTPRTARKRNVEARIPLSDIFSSQANEQQSPNKINKPKPHFRVAEDAEEIINQPVAKSQTDSGYHGSSQVEADGRQNTPELPLRSPLRAFKSSFIERPEDDVQITEGSFHSAKENQTIKFNVPPQPDVSEEKTTTEPVVVEQAPPEQAEFDEIGSPSDESTPDRPPVRKKSSMTFASLPAREPMKTSIGARISRTSHIQQGLNRHPSIAALPKSSSDKEDDEDTNMSDDDGNVEILGHDDSDTDQATKQHSKASTQRLHERIDALGKGPVPRPSKSIPESNIAALHKSDSHKDVGQKSSNVVVANGGDDDDDDWIKPLHQQRTSDQKNGIVLVNEDNEDEQDFYLRAPELVAHEERMGQLSPSPARPLPGFGHTKSASTVTLASPSKTTIGRPASPAKSISASLHNLPSTTPSGSPNKTVNGPLSASKSRLQSIMKTAKGLFTSSASVSAAAKLETITPKVIEKAVSTMPGMFPDLNHLNNKPLPASPPKEQRRTRSSTEKEKDEKRKQKDAESIQKMEDQLEKAREKEKQKVALQQQKQVQASSPHKVEEVKGELSRLMSAPSTKPSRPARPVREISKSKPQPASIRVATLSHQRVPTNSSVTSVHSETLPAEPKRPGLVKKASNASIQSAASTTNFKSSVTAKPKALLAAERKKEQDDREAQRKLEQKREIDRKRAAQQEEARRQEQEQRAEAERKERDRIAAEKAKRQAQQQAIDRKRQEAARKIEEQRMDRTVPEAPPARPPSRLGQTMNAPLIKYALPMNTAKPAKRPAEEETAARPQAPRFGAASQQTDAKRRRTEEENFDAPIRPTMSGAPIRQSQLGKKPSIFNHPSYQAAPQPQIHQFPQPPTRPHPMSQYMSGKIPFAEPVSAGPAKTPVSAYQPRTIQTVKSSPQYPNGESIHLPDIPTDSEDEDSEDEGNSFPIPDWATPGHLTEQLIRQEGMDGDAVFGPIAPLKMEEIFNKGNKDRLKRLRDRTSSANWALSGDGLTLEEVRADREQRERMRLEGGWRYGS